MDIIGNRSIHDKAASPVGLRPVGSDTVKQGHDTPAAPSKDSVELSSRARLLSEGNALLRALPEIRVAVVTELKESIESDAYQVGGERVSDAMIRETLRDGVI